MFIYTYFVFVLQLASPADRMMGMTCGDCFDRIFTIIPVASCMYGHTYRKGMDQPGKVANPARGQLNRENQYFPVPVRA